MEEAVEAARENAAENGLANCEFLAGDVLKVLDRYRCKDHIPPHPPVPDRPHTAAPSHKAPPHYGNWSGKRKMVRKASRTRELLVALVTTSQEPFTEDTREAAEGEAKLLEGFRVCCASAPSRSFFTCASLILNCSS